MPTGACYSYVESTTVLGKTQAVCAHTSEHYYVTLGALKGIHSRHLNLLERIIVEFGYELFEMLHLCFICENDADAVVGRLVVIDEVFRVAHLRVIAAFVGVQDLVARNLLIDQLAYEIEQSHNEARLILVYVAEVFFLLLSALSRYERVRRELLQEALTTHLVDAIAQRRLVEQVVCHVGDHGVTTILRPQYDTRLAFRLQPHEKR